VYGGHLGSSTGGCSADDDPVHHRLGGGGCVPGRVCVRDTDSTHHRPVCPILHPIHYLQGKEVFPGVEGALGVKLGTHVRKHVTFFSYRLAVNVHVLLFLDLAEHSWCIQMIWEKDIERGEGANVSLRENQATEPRS
jgi:hypothetical protein